MPFPAFLKALQTLRALEAAAARGDLKADAFAPWFADWLVHSV